MIQRPTLHPHYHVFMHHTLRTAFTLTEVLVAIVLMTIGLTSFYAYSILILHNLTAINRETIAVNLAHTRAEQLFGTPCIPLLGTDTLDTVLAHWSTTPTLQSTAHLTITTQHNTFYAPRTESYTTTGVCR